MRRARVILTPLLPALWLVASVNCLFDPLGNLTSGSPSTFVSASAQPNRDATASTASLDQSTRRWNRRLDDSSSLGTPSPVAFYGAPEVPSTPALSGVTTSPLALAQGWQFHWRTAAEPRAPSFVS